MESQLFLNRLLELVHQIFLDGQMHLIILEHHIAIQVQPFPVQASDFAEQQRTLLELLLIRGQMVQVKIQQMQVY